MAALRFATVQSYGTTIIIVTEARANSSEPSNEICLNLLVALTTYIYFNNYKEFIY
jgi:hypothetical protein